MALFFMACNAKEKNDPTSGEAMAVQDSLDIHKTFFPVYDFIKSETRYVDSLPVGIKKYITTEKRTDSSYIDLKEFHELAELFLAPEIKPEAFKEHYKESSFYDQSTRSSTFLYEATGPGSAINRIDVQSRPDEIYDKIFRVYVERMDKVKDTLFTRKMTWKPGKEFTIIETVAAKGVASGTRQIKVVWDNWEEE